MSNIVLFRIGFSILMIVAPLAFIALFRPRLREKQTDPRALAIVRRLSLMLMLGTLAGVALVLIAAWSEWVLLNFVWILFFPLWFGLAMPILAIRHPSMSKPPHPEGPARGASLRPRTEHDAPSWIAWLPGWITLALALAAGAAALIVRDAPADRTRLILIFLVVTLTLPIGMVIGMWGTRRAVEEPEPYAAEESPELAAAYARIRRAKTLGFCIGCQLMTASLASAFTLMLWGVNGPAMGWIGAGVGIFFGVAGGVFGTTISVLRARAAELARSLDGAAPAPNGA
ncbi:MAG: hypothetical protein VYC34_03970 [Planctomycetota bacterium]|nr:hypothetical protein [Planctomycetota bacterium]